MKWEYKVISIYNYTEEMREEELNRWGATGWKLITVAKNGVVYLERLLSAKEEKLEE